MKRILLLICLLPLFNFCFSQTENELVNMVARICNTDSIMRNLSYFDEDSVKTIQVQTPDYQKYGTMTYEYEGFNLNFDVNSKLLFSQKPFGKIYIEEYSKKKAVIILEIAGMGDRKAKGYWIYGKYEFEQSKNGKWLLNKVNYSFDEYYQK